MDISRFLLCCLFFSTSIVLSDSSIPDDFFLDTEFKEVLTPTRLKQRIADVPASVTVIDQETIRRLGIRSIPEALRLVPGMVVGMASANEYRISYHGTNGLIPRRMQVLVDGMSVYRTGFAQVDWSTLNVDVDNVDRIEVTRSPSSATYGANSFFGVINIVTKHPLDSQGTAVRAYVGSLDMRDFSFNHGSSFADTAFRVTLLHQEDDGFDKNLFGDERRDGTEFNSVAIRSSIDLSPDSTLDLQLGASTVDAESEFADANQTTFPDRTIDEAYLLSTWMKEFSSKYLMKIKGYAKTTQTDREWNTCYPAALFLPELRTLHGANPDYAAAIVSGQVPSGGTPADDALAQTVLSRVAQLGEQAFVSTCSDINENFDETQADVEIENTLIVSESFRTVFGGGLRYDRAKGETWLNGDVSYYSARLFGTAEYRITHHAILNLGGMFEYEDDRVDETHFSPRAALNYHFNDFHTLRFVLSKAVRTPDILELNLDWNFHAINLNPPFEGRTEGLFYYNAKTDGDLESEEILSKELSYYANLPHAGLSWDISVFEQELDDLISEKLQFFDYFPTNDNSATLRGVEVQLAYQPLRNLYAYLAYAYMDNNTSQFFERTLSPRHSGSAYLSYDFDKGYGGTLAYYGADDISGFSYNRYDLILTKRARLGGNRFDASFILRHFANRNSGFVVNETFSVQNNYDDDTHYYLALRFKI